MKKIKFLLKTANCEPRIHAYGVTFKINNYINDNNDDISMANLSESEWQVSSTRRCCTARTTRRPSRCDRLPTADSGTRLDRTGNRTCRTSRKPRSPVTWWKTTRCATLPVISSDNYIMLLRCTRSFVPRVYDVLHAWKCEWMTRGSYSLYE